MKTVKFLILAIVAISCVNIDFLTAKSSANGRTLENVSVLQASAGEAGCNPTTSNRCRINVGGTVLLEGTGQPWITN